MHKVMLAALVLAGSALAQNAGPSGDWRLYRLGSVKRTVLVERGSAPTLRFENGRVVGTTGCNSYFGAVTVRGKSVSVGALSSTKRACANKVLGVLEGRYLRSLARAQTYGLSGPVLTLLTRDGEVLAFRQGR